MSCLHVSKILFTLEGLCAEDIYFTHEEKVLKRTREKGASTYCEAPATRLSCTYMIIVRFLHYVDLTLDKLDSSKCSSYSLIAYVSQW